jgi:hypothetical protein
MSSRVLFHPSRDGVRKQKIPQEKGADLLTLTQLAKLSIVQFSAKDLLKA